ncbi:MAG TPA: hypothetical protein VFB70_15700 [Pyrinomonadaceae bacterium]|nr:hypothetical protein [Pyrinomonadaceae bacterium]
MTPHFTTSLALFSLSLPSERDYLSWMLGAVFLWKMLSAIFPHGLLSSPGIVVEV